MARGIRWEYVALGLLLALLFWLRLSLSFSQESLSYDSYLIVRQVEHILEEGVPITEDPLSITGRLRVASPAYDYLLALFVWISPMMYKVLPNLLMVLVLIPVYALARMMTNSSIASALAVGLAATGPYVFSSYLNTPSPAVIAIAIFLVILALLQDPDRFLPWIIGLSVLLTFIHPLVFILVLSLLLLTMILKLEGFGVDKRVHELFFFTLLLALWFHLLVFKRAFFAQGVSVIWQNLPAKYAAVMLGNLTFINVLYGLGVVTFLFGALGMYHALFENRSRISFSIIAAILAVSIAALLRLLELQVALLLLTLLLSIMAGHGLLVSVQYLRMTRAPWIVYPLGVIILIFFFFSAILPALTSAQLSLEDSPGPEAIAAYESLRSHVPAQAVVLTTVKEAWAVQYYARRTTLTDADFLLVQNGDELVSDIESVYTARFTTPVIRRSAKLGFTHILFSPQAREEYLREGLQVGESACLREQRLTPDTVLYRVLCGDLQ